MTELWGLYAERDVIPWHEITVRQLQALSHIGFDIHIDGDAKIVKIISDTSEMEHNRCGEPLDSLEMM